MQVKKADKEERIVKAAMQLFAERDYQDVSVNDIASLAHVGKGTIYTYFNEKEEILEACVSFIFKGFVESVKKALKESENVEAFLEMFISAFLTDVQTKSRVLFAFHRRVHKDRKKYECVSGEYRKVMEDFYRKYSFEITVDFKSMYALFTSFLMASYLTYESIEPTLLKSIIKRGLLCAITSSVD